MKNPENVEIEAKNEGNKEALKGHEGEVFENVIFKSFKTNKGKISYKSSSPDRKIIIVSQFSNSPEEGQPCRVLIIEDTDPDSSREGKMFAKIIAEKPGDEEARKLAIETRADIENRKTEHLLTPEDRERLAALLSKGAKYRVWNDPSHGENDEQRARADMVIDLRRQLRKEGPKVVSYLLEYGRAPRTEPAKLYEYSRMLDFAASPKDAKRVIEFFLLDKISKSGDRSSKIEIENIVSRIGTAENVDSLKIFFDKTLTSPYHGQNKSGDANMVFYTLAEIEAKTTNPVEREKISKVMDYIRDKVMELGLGGHVTDMPSPNGPEKLTEEFEEKFFDVELRKGIHDFVDYWSDDTPDDDNFNQEDPQPEAVIQDFKELIKKHGAYDKLPSLVHKAYWALLVRECRDNLEDISLHGAMKKIEEQTGIPVDYHVLRPQIRAVYHEAFLTKQYSFTSVKLARRLYEKTEISFTVEPKIALNAFLDILSDDEYIESDFPEDYLSGLKEVSGTEPDFSVVKDRVQKVYEDIIFNVESYEDAYHDRSRFRKGLKRAELILAATGIRPHIDPVRMQRMYEKWLTGSLEAVKLILAAETLTGIQPESSGMNDAMQHRYDELLGTISDQRSFEDAVQGINGFKTISKIPPVFDEKRVKRLYLEKVVGGWAEAVARIQEVTGIMPDFEPDKKTIQRLYVNKLSRYVYSFDRSVQEVKNIQNITGIKPEFSQDEIHTISETIKRILREVDNVQTLFELEGILPNPEYKVIMGDILMTSLGRADERLFKMATERMRAQNVALNADEAVKLSRAYLVEDPGRVIRVLGFLRKAPQDDELIFKLTKAFAHDPWIAALLRLEKIQASAANAAHDPWVNELRPLLRDMIARKVISTDRKEDAELIVSFIELMGMNNLPQLFSVYVDCQRHKDVNDLSKETLILCEQFGVKARRKDGSLRFNSSPVLFSELSKALKGIQTELLADTIPDGLETKLGAELFSRLKGSTQFEREDNISEIIRIWNKTKKNSPSLAELPPGFKESTMRVPLGVKQKVEVVKDQEGQVKAFLASQEVADAYLPLAQSWELASSVGVDEWFQGLIRRLDGDESTTRELLSKSPEEMERLIADEQNPRTKQAYIKKSKVLQNPKGRQGLERQADTQREAIKKLNEIYRVFYISDASERGENDYAKALESLSALDGTIPLGKEIREFSAFHMYDAVMGKNWKQLVGELFEGNAGAVPTAEKVYGAHKLSKDYVEEHYLHHAQKEDHTEHTPFSPELYKKLNIVWQQQLDKQTGYLPITFLKNKLDKILGVDAGALRKEVAVTMVPVSGLLNVFSGDLGDSCHTSQHHTLAKGDFPRIRSWVYVTQRGKPNEEIRGSVLAIQSEQENGTPVIVVRE